MPNMVLSIAFDTVYWMHWHTIFGHALICSLLPQDKARSVFAQIMALVLAKPSLYCKLVQAFNLAYLDNPFMPMPWKIVSFFMLVFLNEFAGTIVEDDILCVLLHNQTPVK